MKKKNQQFLRPLRIAVKNRGGFPEVSDGFTDNPLLMDHTVEVLTDTIGASGVPSKSQKSLFVMG